MKNKYYPLRSSIDELSTKNDNEIDLEKGPLPEYNSEDGSTLPPYSENLKLKDPKQMGANNPNLFNTDESTTPPDYGEDSLSHRENHSSGTTDNSSPFLIKLLISFIPIFVLNVPAVCYLTYKDALFKDYGKDEWVYFGMWCASCLMIFISLWCFYETWTQAVAQCVKVTAISLAKCVKVISIGLFNIRREMMIIIWILWLIICCILFVYIKSGDLNLNKALIYSTCTISAVLLLIVSSVCIPFWTFERTLAKLAKVFLLQSGIVLVLNGTMFLRGKHFEWTGCEIEASVLFIMGNVLFLCEMECPGALRRMPKSIRNGIASFLGGIANAIRGANDNNDIPLGEMDVESEV
uniref:Meiotic driver wtf30 n=3 Tax=Schizosaccharomyces TaxID=4895 RepID=WTF30_SCHKA|nr:RecName: Full=Meiotic driver wtf30 [Schizosaccharomyces kambucha]QBL54286.1 Wtf30 [Schizosaccharomyces pombe]QBL54516.1 Wtf30 [Schizosaccharomyces kambucha]